MNFTTTLNNLAKNIGRVVVGLLVMPLLVVAANDPSITLDGVTDINETNATVTISFDSGGKEYSFMDKDNPIVFVEYTNTKTNEKLLSGYNNQSSMFKVNHFGLFNLEKGTTYKYRGVLKVAGDTIYTPSKTFITKGAVVQPTPVTPTTPTPTAPTPKPAPTTIPVVTQVNNLSSDIIADAKSKVITGGAVYKNGVALVITNEQARTSVDDTFIYTVQYQNSTKDSLKSAELVIELPEQYEFVKSPVDMTYNERNNTLTYIVGRIVPEKVTTITFTVRAIGDGKKEVRTIATLFYEGGVISATDRDSFHGGSKSVLGASVFGAGFFPQTMVGWMIIIIIMVLIIITARRYTMVPPQKDPHHPQK